MDLRDKLLEIQEYWLREARSRAGETIRNLLNKVLMQLYMEPGQFVLEFLQNAEDALMEAKKKGFFKVELYKDKVVVSHNGKPFDERDLENLCGIKSSKKPALGYKGFIGIGWKSVFRVSKRIEVYSRGVSFEFNKEYWRDEVAGPILKKYELRSEDVIWQITPIPIQSTEFAPEETRFIVYLDDESKYRDVKNVVEELGPSLFLFLEYVNKVEVVDNVEGKRRVVEWFATKEEEFDGAKVKQLTVTVAEGRIPTFYKFLILKKEFEVPGHVKHDPVTVNAERGDVIKREVALAFSLDPTAEELKPVEEAKFWGMYSFLPLYEVRTGLKFLIQADFIVHPGRRYLNVGAEWNKWLMECIAELVKVAIKYLREHYKRSYLDVFEYRELDEEIYKKLIKPTIVKTIVKELEDPAVLCYKGHEVKLSSVVRASEDVLELIKYGFFDEEELKIIFGSEKHILDPAFKVPDFLPKPYEVKLVDLLDEKLIKAKLEKGTKEALIFLCEVYRKARKAQEKGRELSLDKKFVLTVKGVELAHNAYLPKFPPEVEDLRKKFLSVDEYLKTLSFVREDFAECIGPETLKWLEVKEVTLRELVEKIMLKEISIEAQCPEKDKLLAITLLAKKSGVELEKPVWVVTIDGGVEKSSEVYYPLRELREFESYEEVMKLLGLKVLDISVYLKYEEDEEGWKRFFSRAIKGAELCSRYYTYFVPSPDYVDVVERIKGALEKSSIEENFKLVRFLKRLWEAGLKTCLGQLKPIKLVTDDDRLMNSDECLLHDDYGPEERWVRWRNEGFMIGPFVSPKYLEDPSKISSWREFFKTLGVKESVGREIVEKFTEWFVEKKLRERGYEILRRGGDGYDILARSREGEEVYVEVKGRKEIGEGDIKLTENESRHARERKDRYWLVLVEKIPNDPKAWLLKDPEKYSSEIVIPSKKFKEAGERL